MIHHVSFGTRDAVRAKAFYDPVLAVVGRREAEERSVVLRRLPGREQETLPLAEAVARLAEEAKPPG